MLPRTRKGFLLPATLVLASTLLLLAVLLVEQAGHALRRDRQAAMRLKASGTLEANVTPLRDALAEILHAGSAASALAPVTDLQQAPLPVYRPVALRTGREAPAALHSEGPEETAVRVSFNSPVAGMALLAHAVPWSPADAGVRMRMAWAAEDIALGPALQDPSAAWPLPSWHLAPAADPSPLEQQVVRVFGLALPEVVAVPLSSPLPFLPAESPGLVPVPLRVSLRFGIFASGALGSREKVLRIRYYLEGELWNPYNRELLMHSKAGAQPVFRIALANLPDVRIHNLSLGYASGWISLDEAANSASEAAGIHAYVRTAGRLPAGSTTPFFEPDAQSQPEGLARTLHPAFMVGPADHVLVEFRPRAGGITLALLPAGTGDPLQAARDGDGWFRADGFAAEFPNLEFPRADAGPQPFYLDEGSLAFRPENTQVQLLLARTPRSLDGSVDPRRRRLKPGTLFADAAGGTVDEGALAEVRAVPLVGTTPLQAESAPAGALFSWPAGPPRTLLEATDLPQLDEAFRMGAPGAARLNAALDDTRLAWWDPDPANLVAITRVDGATEPYHGAFPVNMLSTSGWRQVLQHSALGGSPDTVHAYAVFPTIDPANPADWRGWSGTELEAAAGVLARLAAADPARSTADFFNRGRLANALAPAGPADPLHPLLTLRGWLRVGPPARPHGSAWILHMAVLAESGGNTALQSARVWLLERRTADNEPLLDIIRLEWTDPREHCPDFPR